MSGSGELVLVYAINRTGRWWSHIAANLGFARYLVVSDIRGAADCDTADDFYAEYRRQRRLSDIQTLVLEEHEVRDIISRCRTLRWLDPRKARCMVAAMERALSRVLDESRPAVIVSFPIDRYVSDVLERLARRRCIPYVELTASLVDGQCMLMYRGQLLKVSPPPSEEMLDALVKAVARPSFTPSYVQQSTQFTAARWLKIFVYFRLRGWVFKVISWGRRDPCGHHYLDAQSFLAHKPRLRDRRVLRLVDWDWRSSIDRFPQSRRIFFGLQLFPEASIDYWLANIRLLDYENLMVKAAKSFSDAGFLVLVKDHPSQFGFRQYELLQRLKAVPNVVFLPYEVSGNEAMNLVDTNFTLTGTLGLQSALLGRASIVAPAYYVTPGDFVLFGDPSAIADLPHRAAAWRAREDLAFRQRRMLSHLLQGSFEGDFFSFRGFNPAMAASGTRLLARNLGDCLRRVAAEGTDAFIDRSLP
jgi:hypothetical protein